MPPRRLPAPLRVLLGGQYGVFQAGNTLSLVGTWMQRIAASWLVWEWTGSAFWLGVLAAADLMPVIFVGPFAGVAADRWDRLRQNRLAQIASAVLALGLAALLASGALGLGLLILFIALQGVLIAAVQPARLAMVQQMVPREDMSVAVALNSVAVNLARLVGPAVAGVLIAQDAILWVFLLNAWVTVIFVLVLGRLRLAPRESVPGRGSFLGQMREGFGHVLTTPALRRILGLLLVGGILTRSVLELVPAIAARSFADASTGLAALTATAALGAVVSGLTMREGRTERLLGFVLVWWTVGASAAAVLALAPNGAVAMAAAATTGAAITRCLIGTQTFAQLAVPDALRGRVLSVHGVIARGSPAVGALAVGYAADRLGLAPAIGAASVVMLACVAGLALLRRNR